MTKTTKTETPRIAYFVVPANDHDDIYAAGDPDGYEHVEDAAADMVALAMTPCFEGPWAIVSPVRRADNGKILQWEALSHREMAMAVLQSHYYSFADEENNELSRVLVDASDEEPIGYITGDCSAEYRGES